MQKDEKLKSFFLIKFNEIKRIILGGIIF